MNNDVIYCVDDRLIHGQILVGWLKPLGIKNVVIVNDFLYQNRYSQKMFLEISKNLKIYFKNTVHTDFSFLQEKTMVMFESIADAWKAYRNGIKFDLLLLLGIRKVKSIIEIPPFIYIDYNDVKDIINLMKKNVKIIAKQFPHAKEIGIEKLLKKKNML